MRIAVDKPAGSLESLLLGFARLQDRLNEAFALLPFEAAAKVQIKCRPEDFPRDIKVDIKRPVWGLQNVYLRNLTDDAVYPTNAPYIDWIPAPGGVKIRGVTGLTSGNIYEFRFIAYG